jgi:hypothetical protein
MVSYFVEYTQYFVTSKEKLESLKEIMPKDVENVSTGVKDTRYHDPKRRGRRSNEL